MNMYGDDEDVIKFIEADEEEFALHEDVMQEPEVFLRVRASGPVVPRTAEQPGSDAFRLSLLGASEGGNADSDWRGTEQDFDTDITMAGSTNTNTATSAAATPRGPTMGSQAGGALVMH